MIRKLLIVFASGLVLSILLISAAWVIGGDELTAQARRNNLPWDWDFGPGEHRRDGPRTSRTFAIDGGKVLTIDLPAKLRFVRGKQSEMTVSGSQRLVDDLQWQDGRLFLGEHRHGHFRSGLTVTITAPQLAGLKLNAPGEVDLDGLDQSSFGLEVAGPAHVEGNGKVGTLNVAVSGPGSIDLGDLAAKDAKVSISGPGNVEIDASGNIDAAISGPGDLELRRKPANLTSSISGPGRVRQDYD